MFEATLRAKPYDSEEACISAVLHGCLLYTSVIGTNDLTQYTHAADRELASAEHYYRPASPAMKKLITMVMILAGP